MALCLARGDAGESLVEMTGFDGLLGKGLDKGLSLWSEVIGDWFSAATAFTPSPFAPVFLFSPSAIP